MCKWIPYQSYLFICWETTFLFHQWLLVKYFLKTTFSGRRFTALVLKVFVNLAKETQIRLIWHELPGNTLQDFALPAFLLNCLGLWTFVFRNQSCLSYCWIVHESNVLLTAASEVSDNSPCSSLSQISILCVPTSHPSLFSPLKMGQTLHLTSQRLRRECETALEFEKNCKRETFFSCMKPTFLHKTGEFKDLWRHFLWSINPLVPAQCTEQTRQTLLLWLRWYSTGYSQVSPKLSWDEDDIYYSLLAALWARQAGGATGAQTAITKVSRGHASCARTHAAL